jgi:phosphatidylinositol 4-kinase
VRNAFLKPFRDKEEKDDREEKEDDEVIVHDRPVREVEIDSIFRRPPKETESENFFKRINIFKDKDDDEKGVRSEELANPDGFFKRFFRLDGDDDEKEGFFRMLMRRKPDEEEEDENSEFLFRKLFLRQVHPEGIEATPGQDHHALIENGPVTENFLKRFLKEESTKLFSMKKDGEEGTKLFSMKRDGEPPGSLSITPSFLRNLKLFKDRSDDEAGGLSDEPGSLSMSTESTDGSNEGNFLQETLRGVMTPFRGKNRTHDSETVGKELSLGRSTEAEQRLDGDSIKKNGPVDADESDSFRREAQTVTEKPSTTGSSWKLPSTDSSFFDLGRSFIKRPEKASTKDGQKRIEKTSTKPPLPKYSASSMRKGVYQATLDLVQSLCDTSSGLVDCFPMEDRLHALREVCGLFELCGLVMGCSMIPV